MSARSLAESFLTLRLTSLQVVRRFWLNSRSTSVLEVTDFSEHTLIVRAAQSSLESVYPRLPFGRSVFQITFWDSEADAESLRICNTGSLIRIENVLPRVAKGYLVGHVNPPKRPGNAPPTLTHLEEDDPILDSLIASVPPPHLS